MFVIHVTKDEKSILETALNLHIGPLVANVSVLTEAHGAGAPCVETARRMALIAKLLSDKLRDAPF